MDPQEIVKAESAKFLDSQFAPLDLSGFPALNQQPMEKFEEQDKHGLNRVDTAGHGAGSGALKQGITSENAKKITKLIRDEGPKTVKTQIQGDEVRVTSKKRDDLQAVIAMLKKADLDVALQFVNYR